MGCNSSGLLSASNTDATLIHKGRCVLYSIKASCTGGNATILKFYDDGAGAANNEIARIHLGGSGVVDNLDLDFHAAICANGLTYEQTVANTNVTFSVQFA